MVEEGNNRGDHSLIDDEFNWPPLPDITPNDPKAEVKKLLYQAQVDVIKAEKQVDLEIHKGQMAADVEREKAIQANEYSMAQAVHNAYLEVAKKEVERRIARSEFIQKVAAAVGSAYVAILALSFTVSKEINRPLPAQGIIPTVFLGMSVVFATIYLAYLENLDSPPEGSYGGRFRESQRLRRNAFIKWAIEPSLHRLYFLHVSILNRHSAQSA
jgi:hypothetical protein